MYVANVLHAVTFCMQCTGFLACTWKQLLHVNFSGKGMDFLHFPFFLNYYIFLKEVLYVVKNNYCIFQEGKFNCRMYKKIS